MRAFIAIDISEQVKEEIKKIQALLPEFFGKKTELENLHLTLKFLGEVEEAKIKEVREKLREVKLQKFEAVIDKIGVFSEKFIRIIWIHMSHCDKLQKLVDEKLEGLFGKEKRFMSHLTIARVKSLKNKKEFLKSISGMKIKPSKFVVEKFKIKKSTLTEKGPIYETIEEFNLE